MSIANRVDSIETHLEDNYQGLINLGADLTGINKNIQNIRTVLDTIYNDLPKVTGEGTEVTLTPTRKGRLALIPKGNSTQESVVNIPISWEQGTISSTGSNVNSDTVIRTDDYIPIKPNILYSMSRTVSTDNMGFRFYDSSKNYLGTQATIEGMTSDKTDNRMSANQSSMTFTITNTNVAYMKMVDISNDLSTVYTLTAPLSPDYHIPIKNVTGNNNVVVQGKNMAHITRISSGQNYLVYSNDELTIVTGANSSNFIILDNTILFEANQEYVLELFSQELSANTNSSTIILQKTGNVPFDTFTYVLGSELYKAFSFTPNENLNMSRILIYNSSSTPITADTTFRLQIRKVNTSSGYQSYITPQTKPLNLGTLELNKIGTYQDYIYKNNGNWYKKEVIKKVNISEIANQFTLQEIRTNTVLIRYYIGDSFDNQNSAIPLLCNNFTWGTVYLNDIEGFQEVRKQIYYSINKTRLATADLAGAKTWLSNSNTILLYILATATDIQITDTTLISQLEDIDKLMGYNGTTIITSTYDSNNAQMILEVSSLKGE